MGKYLQIIKIITLHFLFLGSLLLIPRILFAQDVTLQDDFSDGNLITNPVWAGNISDFVITADSLHMLRLKSPHSGISFISSPSQTAYGSWRFHMWLDFAPSGSNQVLIFLISDHNNLNANLNGYALQVGESGSHDVFHLIRYDNGTPAKTILSGTANISQGGKFNVLVKRDIKGKWTLYVSQGYQKDPVFDGSGKDNRYQSSSYFGLKLIYTSTRSDKFYFDDFLIRQGVTKILDTNVHPRDQIQLIFSTPLDEKTVNINDFYLDHQFGNPSKILTDHNTVILQYDKLLPGGSFLLRTQHIENQFDQPISDTTISFTLYAIPQKQDIVINEFMYDPPSDMPEYVELYNSSIKTFNIQNWFLNDGTEQARTITRHKLLIKPKSYIVLTSDTATLFHHFNMGPFYLMSDFPTLNNSSDIIELKDDSGYTIDSLTYHSNWGGHYTALERRSPDAPSTFAANWADSRSSLSGTPGRPNTVQPDQTPPKLSHISISFAKKINLGFSEDLNPDQNLNTGNFVLGPNVIITSVKRVSSDTLSLQLANSLQNNTRYHLHINNIEDIFANKSTVDTSFTYYHAVPADSGDVMISEFMYDPPEDQSEYIELYNRSNKTINLKNWELADNTGKRQNLTDNKFLLPPKQYIVLSPDNNLLMIFPDISLINMGTRFPTLNNSGDSIVLYQNSGILMDSLSYKSSWGEPGKSMERHSLTIPAYYKENWGTSPSSFGGTPGKPNQLKQDTTPPRLISLNIINDRHISFRFSKRMNSNGTKMPTGFQFSPKLEEDEVSVNRSSITLSLKDHLKHRFPYQLTLSGLEDLFGNNLVDTTLSIYYNPDDFPPKIIKAQFDSSYSNLNVLANEPVKFTHSTRFSLNNARIDSVKIDKNNPDKILIRLKNKVDENGRYKLQITDLADTCGNILRDTTLSITHLPKKRDIVINEIMYSPITNNRDQQPDQCEYVEFYNRRSFTISLSKCFLHDAPDENGKITRLYPFLDSYVNISPHSYMVWYADTAKTFKHSRIFHAFKPSADSSHFYRVDRTTLRLSSKNGAIYLSNQSGKTVDSVYYSDNWQDPNIDDHRGISLERINPDGPSNNANNWGSSANQTGGTPATANTIMIQSESNIPKNSVHLSPNPFSPDHDGFQDELSINYHFDEPDYLLRIRIFDRYGRIVRHLVNNKIAGSEGAVIWNGLKDNGTKSRIGIYIIFIQAYNSSHGGDQTFKKEAVIARKF